MKQGSISHLTSPFSNLMGEVGVSWCNLDKILKCPENFGELEALAEKINPEALSLKVPFTPVPDC